MPIPSDEERARTLGSELARAVQGAPRTIGQTDELLALSLPRAMAGASDSERERLVAAFRAGFLERALLQADEEDIAHKEQLITLAMRDARQAGLPGAEAALALGEGASVAFVLTDDEGAVRLMTPRLREVVGEPDTDSKALSEGSLHDWLSAPTGETFDLAGLVDQAQRHPDVTSCPAQLRQADGETVDATISSVAIDQVGAEGGAGLLLSTVRTSRDHIGSGLTFPDRMTFDDIFRNAYGLTIVIDADHTVRYANPSVHRLLGTINESIAGRDFRSLFLPENQDLYRQLRKELEAAPDQPVRGETWIHLLNGPRTRVEFVAHNIGDGTNSSGIVLHGRDISEQQAYQERLERLAMLDSLTGLPNRAIFMEQLNAALDEAGKGNGDVTVLYIDLDHFKHINDRKGHNVGDSALVEVSQRIAAAIEPEDLLARIGGDEFAVLTRDTNPDKALPKAARIQDALQQPIMSESVVLTGLTASIGVAQSVEGLRQSKELLAAADRALYRAKSHGGGEVKFFDAALRDQGETTSRTIAGIRAVDQKEAFSLWMHPEYDARTSMLTSLVAVPFWEHPGVGLEELDFALLEDHDPAMATSINARLVREAARHFHSWMPHLPDSVNFSIRIGLGLLRSSRYMEGVQQVFSEYCLPSRRLLLRIPADVLGGRGNQLKRDIVAAQSLTDAYMFDGVGAEHASIQVFRRLEGCQIGVDIGGLELCTTEDQLFVDMLVQFSQRLGISITASGVADAKHKGIATQLASTTMSGSYLLPALSADEARVRIEDGTLLAIGSD